MLLDRVVDFLQQTGFYQLFANFTEGSWQNLVMILIACVLCYLAIVKKFEPLLLLPIAIGMLLTNLPGSGMFHEVLFAGGHINWELFGGAPITQEMIDSLINEYNVAADSAAIAYLTENIGSSLSVGLIDILYLGVKLGIYPCLIFIGVGAMTDFGPLISNPKSLIPGAAAQVGIFATVAGVMGVSALAGHFGWEFLQFDIFDAASIGIIGGADGPTAIYTTTLLSPELLGPIAVAAYSYMALVPVIQPPIMKALTTKKERAITMTALRPVSKTQKIIFPIVVTVFVALIVPSATALVGCLMFGNLLRECGVCERLSKTVQNELMNIVTVLLGISVGATATGATFLSPKTLVIIVMGVVAFGVASAMGVLIVKLMNLFLPEGKKINPLIGSAGVSAVPMAARVSQKVGQEENPGNFLLMHAMGPNVAGVIGSAVAAGVLLNLFG